MNASADSTSVTIQGLDGDLDYSVTVAAGTRAGIGVQSNSTAPREGIGVQSSSITVEPTGKQVIKCCIF